jgi:hypothetical protein
VTDSGTRRMWWAVEGQARGVRGEGEDGWGERSATKPIPSTKPVGEVVGSSMTSVPSPPFLCQSPLIQCLLGENIKDDMQLGGGTASLKDGTGKRGGENGTMVSAGMVDTVAADNNCDSSDVVKGRGKKKSGSLVICSKQEWHKTIN